jgi:polar amino acid transport system substrate-binding protein
MWQWLYKAILMLMLGLMAMVASNEAMAAPVPPPILMVSEEWLDYTNADGTGLAWDVLRRVFEPIGYRVRTRTEPYTRAVGLVQRAEADLWVGSYKEETQSLYPRWNYDTDHVYALGLASGPAPQASNLGQYKLAWVHGYEYQRYLPGIKHYTEVLRRNGILSMLDLGRADYYIDAQTEIEGLLKEASHPAAYKMTHVAELPLYIGFSNTAKGRRLRLAFDQRMDSLVPSGQLRELFAKWQQPYPFDAQTSVRRQ